MQKTKLSARIKSLLKGFRDGSVGQVLVAQIWESEFRFSISRQSWVWQCVPVTLTVSARQSNSVKRPVSINK